MLKRGDKVTVYEDPITRVKPEGEVELITIQDESDGMEFWEVRFKDGMRCGRWIAL
jgi:hypothetical protein